MKHNTFVSFCLKVVVFAALLLIVDRAADHLFVVMKNHGMQQNPDCTCFKSFTVVEEVQAELVVIGSSKALHQYIPQRMTDAMHLSAYNCGQDGCFFLFQNCIANMMLDRYHPKLIVWDLQPNCFDGDTSMSEYQNLRHLSPYYGHNRWATDYINGQGDRIGLKMRSGMFKYNSKVLNYALRQLPKGACSQEGYLPYPTSGYALPQYHPYAGEEKRYVRDTMKLDLLAQTAERCKAEGVPLAIFFSPEFAGKSQAYRNAVQDVRRVAVAHGAVCMDHSSDTVFMRDATLFIDSLHLNDKGARLYTDMVVSELQAAAIRR